jgi:hypothetical protein
MLSSAVSGWVCPAGDVAWPRVAGVVVAPGDVAAGHGVLFAAGGVAGAVEGGFSGDRACFLWWAAVPVRLAGGQVQRPGRVPDPAGGPGWAAGAAARDSSGQDTTPGSAGPSAVPDARGASAVPPRRTLLPGRRSGAWGGAGPGPVRRGPCPLCPRVPGPGWPSRRRRARDRPVPRPGPPHPSLPSHFRGGSVLRG